MINLKNIMVGPGWVAQLVRMLSWYAKVVGSIPGQGTCKNQPMNNKLIFLSFSLCLPLSPCLLFSLFLKSRNKNFKKTIMVK